MGPSETVGHARDEVTARRTTLERLSGLGCGRRQGVDRVEDALAATAPRSATPMPFVARRKTPINIASIALLCSLALVHTRARSRNRQYLSGGGNAVRVNRPCKGRSGRTETTLSDLDLVLRGRV